MSRVNPDVNVGQIVRLALIAAGCLIGGVVMLIVHLSQPMPASVDKLTRVEGQVQLETGTRVTRRDSYSYPVLVINKVRYSYLDWFPQADQLPNRVMNGDFIAIWSDVEQQRWVWQIERNGELIVPFTEVHKAVKQNREMNPLFAIVALMIGAGAAVMLLIKTRPFWDLPPPRKPKSEKEAKKKKKPRKVDRLKELPESD